MRPKTRAILEECIENGVVLGYSKAHKHTDYPEKYTIQQNIEDAIWLEIDERFDFDRSLCVEIVEGFDRLGATSDRCNDHPDAPHGFDRDSSHALGRYVCECEGWEEEQ